MPLTFTTQSSLGASIAVGPKHISSPRELNRVLWRPDQHDLADGLLAALNQLAGDIPRTNRQHTLVSTYGVTALSSKADGRQYHAYASLAAHALDTAQERARFLQLTRHLGMSTKLGQSSLQDVRDGPVQILAAADVDAPQVTLVLEDVMNLKSNQRTALLEYLLNLSAGVDVRLVGSHLTLRKLLTHHEEDLPASVTTEAESALHTDGGDISTRSAERHSRARELLADRGEDHVDWTRLKALFEEPHERCSYDRLENHPLTEFSSRDALKQFVSRMVAEDLVESCGAMHDRHIRLEPTGYAVLEEHPSIGLNDQPPSQDAAGRTDDTSQPGTAATAVRDSTVSDPPKSLDSPVYSPSTPQDRSDRPANEGNRATVGGSGSGPASAVEQGYLDSHQHDAAVATAAQGELALVGRPAADPTDRRVVDWSFLEERDEVAVRIHASDHIARTLVRLCAALLADPAFQQVLTEDRLAGGPGQTGLDGLVVSNPYVLRSGACLGYLSNTDATAAGYRKRLRAARNDLLRRLGDIDFTADSVDNSALAQLVEIKESLIH